MTARKDRRSQRRKQGVILRYFTLIELLVVISVIAILASLLLPALNGARDRARTIQCLSKMKALNLAMLQYSVDFAEYLPSNNVNYDCFWLLTIPAYYNIRYYNPVTGGINDTALQKHLACPYEQYKYGPDKTTPVGTNLWMTLEYQATDAEHRVPLTVWGGGQYSSENLGPRHKKLQQVKAGSAYLCEAQIRQVNRSVAIPWDYVVYGDKPLKFLTSSSDGWAAPAWWHDGNKNGLFGYLDGHCSIRPVTKLFNSDWTEK